MPSFTTTTFELIQIQMSPFSTMAINENSNTVVVVVGFCINQLSAFPLPALRPTLRNILDAAIILFYFFLNSIFSYKTPILGQISIYCWDCLNIKIESCTVNHMTPFFPQKFINENFINSSSTTQPTSALQQKSQGQISIYC